MQAVQVQSASCVNVLVERKFKRRQHLRPAFHRVQPGTRVDLYAWSKYHNPGWLYTEYRPVPRLIHMPGASITTLEGFTLNTGRYQG